MTIRKFLFICVFLSLFIEPVVVTMMMILGAIGYFISELDLERS